MHSREIAEIGPPSGTVSAELLEDAEAPVVRLGPGEEFVPAELSRANRPPEYPTHLLNERVPRSVVAVRVIFDEDGGVSSITDSPLADSTPGRYAADFAAAVRRAVEQWRCVPAQIRKFRDGADLDGDGKADYRVMTARRFLRTFFDLSFVFEIVDGQPVVKTTT